MNEKLKGPCEQCGGLLEFAALDSGAEIECPLCQKTTVLRAGEVAGDRPPGGRSRKIIFGAAAAVLVLAVTAAGVALAIKQKGAKPMGAEARAAVVQTGKPSAPEPIKPPTRAGAGRGRHPAGRDQTRPRRHGQ